MARRTSSACFDDVEAADERGAGGRRQQRHQHPDQRGFAGAVGSEQAEDLAFLDGEADAVDGGEVAELLDDARTSMALLMSTGKVHVGRHARRRGGDRGCRRAGGSRTS